MIIFLWVQVYFLANGKYILYENKDLVVILETHVRLLDILKRESRQVFKYTGEQILDMKKEMFTTEILIKCLDFAIVNRLDLFHFCKEYTLNFINFSLRLKTFGVEFLNYELENLHNHNIIHL